ncbi:hypothetical protein C8R42DRAFT_777426 [Lentinula raphanica]|nr:hypothetical protein C8R42DRAFT_777426 [Lentinula raphanica]
MARGQQKSTAPRATSKTSSSNETIPSRKRKTEPLRDNRASQGAESPAPPSKRQRNQVEKQATSVTENKNLPRKPTANKKTSLSSNAPTSTNPSRAHSSAKPITTGRRGAAPKITSDDEIVPKSRLQDLIEQKQQQEDDSGSELSDNDMEEEGREFDRAAASNINVEAVRFVPNRGGSKKNDAELEPERGLPASDSELEFESPQGVQDGNDDNLESMEDVVEKQRKAKKAISKGQKLKKELPIFTTDLGENEPSDFVDPSEDNTNHTSDWTEQSNIILEPSKKNARTFSISLNGQNPAIKTVIQDAIQLAALKLVSEIEFCALTSKGLTKLTKASLVQAAENKGMVDIVDRLENGDYEKYIKPLVKYTMGRIILTRRTLKGTFAPIILAALKLDNSPSGIQKSRELIINGDFIYPQKPDGSYDYGLPFQHEVVSKYLGAAFFSTTQYSKLISQEQSNLFTSSRPSKPFELEVPKAMAMMAGCVIYAVLKDHSTATANTFPPAGVEEQWDTFEAILDRFETTKKHTFHQLMHDLYRNSSNCVAPATHGLSKDAVLARINRAIMNSKKDEESDDESNNEPTGNTESGAA